VREGLILGRVLHGRSELGRVVEIDRAEERSAEGFTRTEEVACWEMTLLIVQKTANQRRQEVAKKVIQEGRRDVEYRVEISKWKKMALELAEIVNRQGRVILEMTQARNMGKLFENESDEVPF